MTEESTNPQAEEKREGFLGAVDQFFTHQKTAFDESGKAIDALLPDGFKEHSATAREEFKKGFKVLIDATIDELEKMTKSEAKEATTEPNDTPPSTTGTSKVKVQVD